MEKTVNITSNPKEVAELLFEMDQHEVAQTFAEWRKIFDENYEERRAKGQPIWIFGLDHFLMHVVDVMEDEELNLIRGMYSHMIYRMVDNIEKKHLLELRVA